MTIREQLEQQELEYLSPDACPNIGHARRLRPEPPCPYRTEFQRDTRVDDNFQRTGEVSAQ